MTKNEQIAKERIDKILKNISISNKQADEIYNIYNTREMQEFLEWKPTWNLKINDWYNSLEDSVKPLVKNLIILFNIQPSKKENRKMEEIKQEEIVQPTVTVTEKVETVEKPKIKRAAKKSKEFYEPIIKEIDEMKNSGKKVREIMDYLAQKYPDVKTGTLMSKYFEWKRKQNKGE